MELPELPTLGGTVTVFGLLFWLVIHFVRQGGADRSAYTDQVSQIREDHDKQIESLISRHDKQTEAYRAEIDNLRARLESERRAKWKAEDAAAQLRRKVEELSRDDGPTA